MKILYLPCHSTLEFDQYKLWTELGHEVYSMGSYLNPASPHDIKRPALEGKYDDHFVSVRNVHSQDNLHPDQIEPMDIIIVDHVPEWIVNNWEKIKHKKVIWRSIGQSIAYQEQKLHEVRKDGLLVVRYSPLEQNIAFNIGEDAMIRFYKDPEEFKDWNGLNNQIITIAQSMKRRDQFCGYSIFEEATKDLERGLYGADNEDSNLWKGQLSYEELKAVLRDSRSFFYTGTQPASYTLAFIEALMTGIPVIAIGKNLGNSEFKNEQDTYEVPEIIESGKNGFCSDDMAELKSYVEYMQKDWEKARELGEAGRKTAIDLFGKEKIKAQWKDFLDGI